MLQIAWVLDASKGINHISILNTKKISKPTDCLEPLCGFKSVLISQTPDPLRPCCKNCVEQLGQKAVNELIEYMKGLHQIKMQEVARCQKAAGSLLVPVKR